MDLGWDIGLNELRPVWLMGPDVASRMLPLRPIFDLVIYDEASQMPVEFALPSLFRGKAVVVSGDDKQLPPTSFFANRVDSDEEETPEFGEAEDLSEEERRAATESWNRREIKDCPNLLELSKSVLRKVMLQVHYRSAYRELIAFSNNAFYDGALNVPVRHPVAEVDRARPIEVVRVDGLYEQRTNAGRSAGSRQSAGRHLEGEGTAVDRSRDIQPRPGGPHRAAGSRNAPRKMRRSGPHTAGSWAGPSTARTWGSSSRTSRTCKETSGITSSFRRRSAATGPGLSDENFGVLGQSGGERRLNVAVTRARKKITVLTSMPVDEIADVLSSGMKPQQPRDYLQLYLAYAAALSAGEYGTAQSLLGQVLKDGAGPGPSSVAELDGFARSVASYVEALWG